MEKKLKWKRNKIQGKEEEVRRRGAGGEEE